LVLVAAKAAAFFDLAVEGAGGVLAGAPFVVRDDGAGRAPPGSDTCAASGATEIRHSPRLRATTP
jgi:hypothetical protein